MGKLYPFGDLVDSRGQKVEGDRAIDGTGLGRMARSRVMTQYEGGGASSRNGGLISQRHGPEDGRSRGKETEAAGTLAERKWVACGEEEGQGVADGLECVGKSGSHGRHGVKCKMRPLRVIDGEERGVRGREGG